MDNLIPEIGGVPDMSAKSTELRELFPDTIFDFVDLSADAIGDFRLQYEIQESSWSVFSVQEKALVLQDERHAVLIYEGFQKPEVRLVFIHGISKNGMAINDAPKLVDLEHELLCGAFPFQDFGFEVGPRPTVFIADYADISLKMTSSEFKAGSRKTRQIASSKYLICLYLYVSKPNFGSSLVNSMVRVINSNRIQVVKSLDEALSAAHERISDSVVLHRT
jgi:hypothetical protein